MTLTLSRLRPGTRLLVFSLFALALAMLVGWIVRYQIMFGSKLIPGINGAYYPVQVRALLNSGRLGIPDLPLLFYLQAGISVLVSLFTPQAEAIMSVVRWMDVLLPPLIAIPVFFFAQAFPRSGKASLTPAVATILAGLVASTNPGLTRMAGDFQKNAAALPLSLTAIYFLYQSLNHHRRRDIALSITFLGLTCLTHIGAAALTLTITSLIAIISLATHPDRKGALKILIGVAVTLCLVLALAALYDIERVTRLFSVAFDPQEIFNPSALDAAPGMRQGGKPGGPSAPSFSILLGIGLGLLGFVILVFDRKILRPAERTLVLATSMTAILFASPLIGREWAQRLGLMAFAPALVPFTYLLVRHRWAWIAGLPVAVLVVMFGFGTAQDDSHHLTIEAYQELQSFEYALIGEETLVVAEHGLEWWVAWILETEVSNRIELAAEYWDDYDTLYILDQIKPIAFKGGSQGPSPSPPPPPGSPVKGDDLVKQPTNKPIIATMGGIRREDTETVAEGDIFRLARILTQPLILHSSKPPALQGRLESIGDASLRIADAVVILESETVISREGRLISSTDLVVGEEVLVWGSTRLFSGDIIADYIVANPPGPVGFVPPPEIQPEKIPERLEPGHPTQPPEETISMGALSLVPREGWGALPANMEAPQEFGEFDPLSNPVGVMIYPEPLSDWLTTVVVHHSALPTTMGPLDIQQLHFNRGLADVAYHYLIGSDGTLFEGRPINVRGAHVTAHNTGTVGVVLIGNMEFIEPTANQMDMLRSVVGYLQQEYAISHLAGHIDFNPQETKCPGENLYGLLPDLAAEFNLTYGTGGYITPDWVDDK